MIKEMSASEWDSLAAARSSGVNKPTPYVAWCESKATDEPMCNPCPPKVIAGALGTQVGGDHYRKLLIQPVEYISANELDFLQGNAIKYLSRHKGKGGAEDIKKAMHYCQLILELQYGVKNANI